MSSVEQSFRGMFCVDLYLCCGVDPISCGGTAFETESCQHSEVSYLWLGLGAHLRALETFGF